MATPTPAILTWRNLHLADTAVRDELNARLTERLGCSLTEHDLMAWLAVAPQQRLRMQDLADRLRVTPGGLTRIIDRLVERGWVQRNIPADNRREVHATLTSKGRSTLQHACRVYTDAIDETFTRHLDQPDVAALDRIARKLLDHLGFDEACTGASGPARW